VNINKILLPTDCSERIGAAREYASWRASESGDLLAIVPVAEALLQNSAIRLILAQVMDSFGGGRSITVY
jgi:hypothetical protein